MMASREQAAFNLAYEQGWEDATVEDLSALLREIEEGEDPRLALRYLGILNRWLGDHEEDLVIKAQAEGWGWSEIGRALGRSRQAVWKLYRNPEDPAPTEGES